MREIIKIGDQEKIENFISKLKEKKPLFICVIGNTETAKIPGISAAGANPEITDYTPAADVEYLEFRRCKCIDGVPVTPDGIPTPGLITKASLEIANIPNLTVVGGVKILPEVPFLELGGKSGGNISNGQAVEEPKKVFKNALILGKNLSKLADYLVIGESIAGGTTTALGVLHAMGYDATDKISSSLPINPIELKIDAIKSGMKANNISKGDLKDNPFQAIEYLGDPMQPAHAGITIGAASNIPVILAGGTQMSAILALIKKIKPNVLENIAIGTTRWIVDDKNTDLKGIVDQINPNTPILAANLDFSRMKAQGLQAYEMGVVKEGVGAGGSVISCLLSSQGAITIESIHKRIEKDYDLITNHD
ncbi:MAG: nicotinate mononucleotide-dependent phosphoribosyltransferase CobT [Promethearchaeota archaeon]